MSDCNKAIEDIVDAVHRLRIAFQMHDIPVPDYFGWDDGATERDVALSLKMSVDWHSSACAPMTPGEILKPPTICGVRIGADTEL